MNTLACFRREPDLDEMMKDPIVRLLMRQDRVTESEIRKLGKSVRGARSGLPAASGADQRLAVVVRPPAVDV